MLGNKQGSMVAGKFFGFCLQKKYSCVVRNRSKEGSKKDEEERVDGLVTD